MNNYSFTICTPNHNATKYLPYLFQSLKAQTYPWWDVVVIDDASTDNFSSFIENQTIIEKERLTVFEYKKNVGPFTARRKAFSLAKGDFVLCIDADDGILKENMLEKINSIASCYYPDIIMFNMTRDPIKQSPSFINYKNIFGSMHGPIDRNTVLQAFVSTYSLNNLASKAIKRTLLTAKEQNEVFIINEDRLETLNTIRAAKSFYLHDENYYYYRENPESTTKTHPTIDSFRQITEIEKRIFAYALEQGLQTNDELTLYLKNIDNIIYSLSTNTKWKSTKNYYVEINKNAFFKTASQKDRLYDLPLTSRLSIGSIHSGRLMAAFLVYKTRIFINAVYSFIKS